MPNWRLLPDPSSSSYKIYLSSPSHQISLEIVKELKKIAFDFVLVSSPSQADIVIYLIVVPKHLKEIPDVTTKTVLIVKSSLLRHPSLQERSARIILSFESY